MEINTREDERVRERSATHSIDLEQQLNFLLSDQSIRDENKTHSLTIIVQLWVPKQGLGDHVQNHTVVPPKEGQK